MVDITNLDVRCASCDSIVSPNGPKYDQHLKIAGALTLGLVGFLTGSVIGIATAGFGMAATLPLGGLGLFFGYFVGGFAARAHDGYDCPDCGSGFGSWIPGR
ncbi:hypothetical protein [Halorubellus salinus]|uniref:hypothetical protein n=1 Tax=Halorubellus salinus TaxID=755309 RepID=UPI001D06E039|nr:hypothetical protein [Halorubellus salinus]